MSLDFLNISLPQMAELSHGVAVLAEGVAMMETTLVGVIQVDPRRLLEDGVRRELVLLVAKILHEGLTFNTKVKVCICIFSYPSHFLLPVNFIMFQVVIFQYNCICI